MKNEIEKYLSKFRDSESSYPFGPEALVFKVMGKMFALISQEEDIPRVTLKCNPEDAATLTGQFKSVSPGYYMNKKHWVTISLTGELSQDMLISLAEESYRLVASKLTKKDGKMGTDLFSVRDSAMPNQKIRPVKPVNSHDVGRQLDKY